MCHRIGRPPISTMGLGFKTVSSARREPNPPANITAFIFRLSPCNLETPARTQLPPSAHESTHSQASNLPMRRLVKFVAYNRHAAADTTDDSACLAPYGRMNPRKLLILKGYSKGARRYGNPGQGALRARAPLESTSKLVAVRNVFLLKANYFPFPAPLAAAAEPSAGLCRVRGPRPRPACSTAA